MLACKNPKIPEESSALRTSGSMGTGMNVKPKKDELMALLNALKQRHRDLDTAIDSLEHSGTSDQLQLRRLKKEKLALKDRISRIEDQILPDIIA